MSNSICSLKQIIYLFVVFKASLEMQDSCLLLFSCLDLVSNLGPGDWQNFRLDPREFAVQEEWLLVGASLSGPIAAVAEALKALSGSMTFFPL